MRPLFSLLAVAVTAGAAVADEADAARYYEKLGGVVVRDEAAPGKPVVRLLLNNARIVDEDLGPLAELPRLKWLSLSKAAVTDAAFRHVAKLPDLETVGFGWTRVTGKGLGELAGLKKLRSLELISTHVNDAGLKEVGTLTQLDYLRLDHTLVTDAGVKELAGLRHLRTLDLSYTAVGDAGVKAVAGLSWMTNLRLTGTKVTDAGVADLARLRRLHTLGLGFTAVTGTGLKDMAGLEILCEVTLDKISADGVKALSGLKQLRRLSFVRGSMPSAAFDELRRALPTCEFLTSP